LRTLKAEALSAYLTWSFNGRDMIQYALLRSMR